MLIENVRIIQEQFTVPCCSAFSVLTAIEAIGSMNSIGWNFSRLFLYYNSRKLQRRIKEPGANLSFTFSALENFGCCEEYHWPFMNHRVDKEPNAQAYNKAEKFKIIKYKFIYDADFKPYLDNNIPIVAGVRTGIQFLNLNGSLDTQYYYPINDTNNTFVGNHAITIVGYSDSLCGGSWILVNSRGLRWGDHGFGIIPYSCNKDIFEAYSIESFCNLTPKKKISDN